MFGRDTGVASGPFLRCASSAVAGKAANRLRRVTDMKSGLQKIQFFRQAHGLLKYVRSYQINKEADIRIWIVTVARKESCYLRLYGFRDRQGVDVSEISVRILGKPLKNSPHEISAIK